MPGADVLPKSKTREMDRIAAVWVFEVEKLGVLDDAFLEAEEIVWHLRRR